MRQEDNGVVSVLGRMFMAAVWAVVLPGALLACVWAVRTIGKRCSKNKHKKNNS